MRSDYQNIRLTPYLTVIGLKAPELAGFTPKNAYIHANCSTKLPEKRRMNNNLSNVKRTLHDLLKSLPAVKNHCSAEVHKRHLALIAYYQRRYDLLAAAART